MNERKKMPRMGAEIDTLFRRKAGAMVHKNDRRRKTRNKTRIIRDAIREG